MQNLLKRFWDTYERRYNLYAGIATGLFLLQIVHLYWLTTHVVSQYLFGASFFNPSPFWEILIILVDYTEIPALIATSVLYLYSMSRKGWNAKDALFLLMLNSQWLHLFWISDEFVIDAFLNRNTSTILPVWLAWIALVIDYLELPVMYDTIKKFVTSFSKRGMEAHSGQNDGRGKR